MSKRSSRERTREEERRRGQEEGEGGRVACPGLGWGDAPRREKEKEGKPAAVH